VLTRIEPVVYQGAVGPETLQVQIAQGDALVDLTTVTSASLLVQLPNGKETTWTAVIAAGPIPPAPTTTLLTLLHAFVAGDVDAVGPYVAVAVLSVPGGTVRSKPQRFKVVDKFAIDRVFD
jgi:hypothetical protein